MADNVIHGTGRPRFVLPTEELLAEIGITDTVASSGASYVVLTSITEAQINSLDNTFLG